MPAIKAGIFILCNQLQFFMASALVSLTYTYCFHGSEIYRIIISGIIYC